jgi:mRNA interferase HicA
LKRRELERHLAAHGCEVLREGANHTIWHNPTSDHRTPVPRHREIPAGTARAICRQLAIAPPSGAR